VEHRDDSAPEAVGLTNDLLDPRVRSPTSRWLDHPWSSSPAVFLVPVTRSGSSLRGSCAGSGLHFVGC